MNGERRPRTWFIYSESSGKIYGKQRLAFNDESQFGTKKVSAIGKMQRAAEHENSCRCEVLALAVAQIF
jgi:hypothetical protein